MAAWQHDPGGFPAANENGGQIDPEDAFEVSQRLAFSWAVVGGAGVVDHDVHSPKALESSIEKPPHGILVRDVRDNRLGVILSQLSGEGRKPVSAPARQYEFGAPLTKHVGEVLTEA
ncbi:MAG: hypothetical protein NVS9B1_11550 [Candidatus Dormibacteraceae bacterium]